MFKVVCVGAFHRKGIKLLESRPDLVTYEVLTDLSPKRRPRRGGADAGGPHNPLPRETLERADRLPDRVAARRGTDNGRGLFVLAENPYGHRHRLQRGVRGRTHAPMLLALAKDAMAGDRATRSGISPGVIGGRRRTWRASRR